MPGKGIQIKKCFIPWKLTMRNIWNSGSISNTGKGFPSVKQQTKKPWFINFTLRSLQKTNIFRVQKEKFYCLFSHTSKWCSIQSDDYICCLNFHSKYEGSVKNNQSRNAFPSPPSNWETFTCNISPFNWLNHDEARFKTLIWW